MIQLAFLPLQSDIVHSRLLQGSVLRIYNITILSHFIFLNYQVFIQTSNNKKKVECDQFRFPYFHLSFFHDIP